MKESLSTDERLAWHGSGPLWEEFVAWSKRDCSPGGGSGHLVPWYWDIWRASAEAKDRLYDRTVRT